MHRLQRPAFAYALQFGRQSFGLTGHALHCCAGSLGPHLAERIPQLLPEDHAGQPIVPFAGRRLLAHRWTKQLSESMHRCDHQICHVWSCTCYNNAAGLPGALTPSTQVPCLECTSGFRPKAARWRPCPRAGNASALRFGIFYKAHLQCRHQLLSPRHQAAGAHKPVRIEKGAS